MDFSVSASGDNRRVVPFADTILGRVGNQRRRYPTIFARLQVDRMDLIKGKVVVLLTRFHGDGLRWQRHQQLLVVEEHPAVLDIRVRRLPSPLPDQLQFPCLPE